MSELSIVRLSVLRATYLFIAVGLAVVVWPGLINPPPHLDPMRGVVRSLLGAVGLLALLGIRYPLQMLPLLFFELVWKTIWIVAFGLPLWRAGALDAATRATWFECLLGVGLCVVAIPWRYVVENYIRKPGGAWRRPGMATLAHEPMAR